jgi:hypothetical protein
MNTKEITSFAELAEGISSKRMNIITAPVGTGKSMIYQPHFRVGQTLYAPRVYRQHVTKTVEVDGVTYVNNDDHVLETKIKEKTIIRINIEIDGDGAKAFYATEDWFRHPEEYFDRMCTTREEAEAVIQKHLEEGTEFYG